MAFITIDNTLAEVWELVWKQLRSAPSDRSHPFRLLNLGTQMEEQVRQRYVVLRDVTGNNKFIIFTDLRSAKVEQLQQNPQASLLAYHPEEKFQVQVDVHCILHHQDSFCQAYWKSIPEPLKKAYTSRLAPGSTIPHPSAAHDWIGTINEQYFCVLEFTPLRVEVLQLVGLAHLRAEFDLSRENGKGKWLVP